MSDDRKLILSPCTGRKKRKAWNKTREKYMPVKKKDRLKQIGDHITIKRKSFEKLYFCETETDFI